MNVNHIFICSNKVITYLYYYSYKKIGNFIDIQLSDINMLVF